MISGQGYPYQLGSSSQEGPAVVEICLPHPAIPGRLPKSSHVLQAFRSSRPSSYKHRINKMLGSVLDGREIDIVALSALSITLVYGYIPRWIVYLNSHK